MAVELCPAPRVQKGWVPCVIHHRLRRLTSPRRTKECSIASIHPSILSYHTRVAHLPVKLKLRDFHFHPPLLLLAIPKCPSTCIRSPSPRATARCRTRLRSPNPPRLPLRPGLLRPRLAADHPRAPISSASLARLRRTSKTQIASIKKQMPPPPLAPPPHRRPRRHKVSGTHGKLFQLGDELTSHL